jgi:hypothetical protein|tara:strand:+ start:420 stop:542 length:123 start_codon:yes stop_codon:yes gene_type:complete
MDAIIAITVFCTGVGFFTFMLVHVIKHERARRIAERDKEK